jgi:hypothetical protein
VIGCLIGSKIGQCEKRDTKEGGGCEEHTRCWHEIQCALNQERKEEKTKSEKAKNEQNWIFKLYTRVELL